MNSQQLETSLKEVLQNYWRQAAALRIYSQQAEVNVIHVQSMQYSGIPEIGIASGFMVNETLIDALQAIDTQHTNRLAPDLFLAIIAHFESFLVESLHLVARDTNGTLGKLQERVQLAYPVPLVNVEEVDEIRERRNMMIHHAGQIKQRYIDAATKVYTRASPWVDDPTSITTLTVSPPYLSYCVDVLCRYAYATRP